jgi:maltooligosyltrehalose trehalohydrolase
MNDPETIAAYSRRLPIGAEVLPGGGVHFRIWASNASGVEVVFESIPTPVRLKSESAGYFSGFAAEARAGMRYKIRLDHGESYPDMASRFQPEGPHGPSEIVDPDVYRWDDETWRGPHWDDVVLYELHIGTFTERGTWESAAEHLIELVELGVNTVEVMPVAEFPGRFGWGYDGVDLFAPYHHYGSPDDMRRFVDRAHALGLAVILDVVYNHFGPDGAYATAYSKEYFHHERGANDWGDALNFDGPMCGPVREFFVSNAVYWITEFHLDGLRLDACQAIHDSSEEHILAALSRKCREAAGDRRIYLVAENEPQETRLFEPIGGGGYGLDAVWTDDFHHSARVALTGRTEAYYCDYQGTPQELISAVKWGFVFQGTFNKWQQKLRGAPALGYPPARFVTYMETHDQVANSPRGSRLRSLSAPDKYRALAALWLLAPQTPMFFQGQEWGSTRPFTFFGDHRAEAAKLMRQGRLRSLAEFPTMNRPDSAERIADPAAESTFLAAKLDRAEQPPRDRNPIYALFRDLLTLRREDPVFRARRADWIHGSVIAPEAFVVRYLGGEVGDRLIVVNLGRDIYPPPATEPLLAPPAGMVWSVLWSSEALEYDGQGIPLVDTRQPWRITAHATLVLVPVPEDSVPPISGQESALAGEVQDVHPGVLEKLRERRG